MRLLLTILLLIRLVSAGEVMPIEIPLEGEAADRSLEMSGLAWYGCLLYTSPSPRD